MICAIFVVVAFLLGGWVQGRITSGDSIIPFVGQKPKPTDETELKPTRFTSEL